MKLLPFRKPPYRYWWVHPDEPGSSVWVATFLGPLDDDTPTTRRGTRLSVIDWARCHPVHFGLPVIAQVEISASGTGGWAA